VSDNILFPGQLVHVDIVPEQEAQLELQRVQVSYLTFSNELVLQSLQMVALVQDLHRGRQLSQAEVLVLKNLPFGQAQIPSIIVSSGLQLEQAYPTSQVRQLSEEVQGMQLPVSVDLY
jgi:hypothetical protein